VKRLRAERAAESVQLQKKEAPKAAGRPEGPRPRKAGLSQKEERRLAELETAMAELNHDLAGLEVLLGSPDAFLSAGAPGHQALRDQEAAKTRLETLELEWLELEEKRNG
jgi:ATP-binding cassette subfamily F protein uup